ncbi:MAG TPA: hypothetical protein DEO43_03075 [Halieaceae bacterium]|nr:hypothetical protein [Halieaceae bacterium]
MAASWRGAWRDHSLSFDQTLSIRRQLWIVMSHRIAHHWFITIASSFKKTNMQTKGHVCTTLKPSLSWFCEVAQELPSRLKQYSRCIAELGYEPAVRVVC